MPIKIRLDRGAVEVETSVFRALFDESVVSRDKKYIEAVDREGIGFTAFVGLARKADIPYSLFFAPEEFVRAQSRRKAQALLAGVSKTTFSINSRSRVELRDVELIVKDLLRKQELVKRLDSSLRPNSFVGCLRRSRGTITEDAARLRTELVIPDRPWSAKTKEKAFDYLVERLEERQVLVSQSERGYMPQTLPKGVKFSGLCVKDKKVPYIFLTSGDFEDNPEPAGRRIFTLTLLAVLIAHGKFFVVTYQTVSPEPAGQREYELTEEVLMPAATFRDEDPANLEGIIAGADRYTVTPSAFVMRARRLGMLSPEDAAERLDALQDEFARRPKTRPRHPAPQTAIRKYNGAEFTRRMFDQLDRGRLSPGDFRRVVCLNKLPPDRFGDLRRTL